MKSMVLKTATVYQIIVPYSASLPYGLHLATTECQLLLRVAEHIE